MIISAVSRKARKAECQERRSKLKSSTRTQADNNEEIDDKEAIVSEEDDPSFPRRQTEPQRRASEGSLPGSAIPQVSRSQGPSLRNNLDKESAWKADKRHDDDSGPFVGMPALPGATVDKVSMVPALPPLPNAGNRRRQSTCISSMSKLQGRRISVELSREHREMHARKEQHSAREAVSPAARPLSKRNKTVDVLELGSSPRDVLLERTSPAISSLHPFPASKSIATASGLKKSTSGPQQKTRSLPDRDGNAGPPVAVRALSAYLNPRRL
ncbi:unnamed protein product [Vitrella brassicaformis CCMP3155]|uniref:Uncharacterized protein n=1 Tax=Vitrella brassicaformis (strain CCMP3155) TaxID=1169540 RepID=A0A0G4E882_VITBC|nr:unnamed protein product [Vitrella brassicaformis CCMP3155]|eukprot:CEL91795.1 unnamed protein product [Vitrella brassicaformis CCMP3155]